MGIAVNSIRVGSYLKLSNSNTTEIKLDGIAFDGSRYICAYNGDTAPVNALEGIRLTSEWLYSCGFIEVMGNDFVYQPLPKIVFRLKEQSVGVIVNDTEIKNICFLHELQNLVFILSGKELVITNVS